MKYWVSSEKVKNVWSILQYDLIIIYGLFLEKFCQVYSWTRSLFLLRFWIIHPWHALSKSILRKVPAIGDCLYWFFESWTWSSVSRLKVTLSRSWYFYQTLLIFGLQHRCYDGMLSLGLLYLLLEQVGRFDEISLSREFIYGLSFIIF